MGYALAKNATGLMVSAMTLGGLARTSDAAAQSFSQSGVGPVESQKIYTLNALEMIYDPVSHNVNVQAIATKRVADDEIETAGFGFNTERGQGFNYNQNANVVRFTQLNFLDPQNSNQAKVTFVIEPDSRANRESQAMRQVQDPMSAQEYASHDIGAVVVTGTVDISNNFGENRQGIANQLVDDTNLYGWKVAGFGALNPARLDKFRSLQSNPGATQVVTYDRDLNKTYARPLYPAPAPSGY